MTGSGLTTGASVAAARISVLGGFGGLGLATPITSGPAAATTSGLAAATTSGLAAGSSLCLATCGSPDLTFATGRTDAAAAWLSAASMVALEAAVAAIAALTAATAAAAAADAAATALSVSVRPWVEECEAPEPEAAAPAAAAAAATRRVAASPSPRCCVSGAPPAGWPSTGAPLSGLPGSGSSAESECRPRKLFPLVITPHLYRCWDAGKVSRSVDIP